MESDLKHEWCLHTSSKAANLLHHYIMSELPSFTMLHGWGQYLGSGEACAVIILICDNDLEPPAELLRVAAKLRESGENEVLITHKPVNYWSIQ